MVAINKSGLYSLILTTRKEAAKRFKKWVSGEALPAIRKTGGYMLARPEETAGNWRSGRRRCSGRR